MKAAIRLISMFLLFFLLQSGCAQTAEVTESSVTPDTAPRQLPDGVTQEEYQETYTDIEALIEKLNIIIENRDFEAWKNHLSESYIHKMSSKETLDELSELPVLKKNNIRLNSLRNYFIYVVIPSRSDVYLSGIEYIDEKHVKAYMIIDDERIILYNFVLVGSTWKIGTG